MKIWVTKYALTQGIFEYEVPDVPVTENTIAVPAVDGNFPTYFHGPDWHRTKEDAIERANFMRIKKRLSLRKQIAKLDSMAADPAWPAIKKIGE